MSYGASASMACLATIGIGWAITFPLELRSHRWWKIILSLPIVALITSAFYELHAISGYFALWSVALLGFIWKSPLAHFFSLFFLRLLHGDLNRPTGFQADFGAAKALQKHGDLEEAILITRQELEKAPFNYEGTLLLADLHMQAGKPGRALKALDFLLTNGTPTSDQRRIVEHQKEALKAALLVKKLNAK